MYLGIDVGGTKIRAGLIHRNKVIKKVQVRTLANAPKKEFFNQLVEIINSFNLKEVEAIGLGIPGMVKDGFSTMSPNVKAINDIYFKKDLEKLIKKKVYVTNDANCFVLGEYLFGKAKEFNSIVGITLGTGIGSGIVINGKLVEGLMGGTGEIGNVKHRRTRHKNYCSSRFFKKKGVDAKVAYQKAKQGYKKYINMYENFGREIGLILSMFSNILAPECIVIGGSISKAREIFEKSMIESYKRETSPIIFNNTKILFSGNKKNSSILGAAALCKKN